RLIADLLEVDVRDRLPGKEVQHRFDKRHVIARPTTERRVRQPRQRRAVDSGVVKAHEGAIGERPNGELAVLNPAGRRIGEGRVRLRGVHLAATPMRRDRWPHEPNITRRGQRRISIRATQAFTRPTQNTSRTPGASQYRPPNSPVATPTPATTIS